MKRMLRKSFQSSSLDLSRPAACQVRRSPLPKIDEKEEVSDLDKETLNSCPLQKKFDGPLPRLPFCEEYDGVNMRKTSTISQSIVELLASQKREREEKNRIEDDKVEYKSTIYHDSLEDIQVIVKAAGSSASEPGPYPECPAYGMTYSCGTGGGCGLQDSFDPFCNIRVEHDYSDGIYTIDLELEHMHDSNTLELKVVKAGNVTDRKSSNKLINTFVKVSMYHGKKNKKQKVVIKSRDPVFNHTFHLDDESATWMHLMSLRVQLYQKKFFRKVCIGETMIWLDDLEFASQKQVTVSENLREPFL